jgi:hypothetical protein
MHHQLPIWYEIGTELLNSLCQYNATYISNHIHKWRQRCGMIKTQIPEKLLMEWFTKSLLLPFARYVAMDEEVTKEQTILSTQQLDLIYSQSDTLYYIIPNAPRPLTNTTKPNLGPHVDGVVGFVFHTSINQLDDQMGQMSINSTYGTSVQNFVVPTQTSKVNLVHSMQLNNPQQPGENKKEKKRKKNYNTEKGNASTQNT